MSNENRWSRIATLSNLVLAASLGVAVGISPGEVFGKPRAESAKAGRRIAQKPSAASPAKELATGAAVTGSNRSKNSAIDMERSKLAVPQAERAAEAPSKRNLEVVKPPRSSSFYESGGKEAQYEKVLDQEIKTLFQLSQQVRKSPNRGEVWLRLGERYVEKARIVSLREQAEYEKQLREFAEKSTKIRPTLNARASREYNEKAVQLYEWFIKDFPKDSKVDQALFFLGYNHFELGNTQVGERYYSQLVSTYPESSFITESRFALGEYYFENESWQKALDNYLYVIKVKQARLNSFALYKSSWCLYRLNRTKVGLQALEKVIRQGRSGSRDQGASEGGKPVNRLRLAQEALKDYVPFYAEAGDPAKAKEEFARVSGSEKQAMPMLERLAFIYADKGERQSARSIFRELIGANPTAERSAEFQHQIVVSFASHDPKEFNRELEIWLESFGPDSPWAKANSGKGQVVAEMTKLQESTLRNKVLEAHQAAQNSQAPFSQNAALHGYAQYGKYFSSSPKIVEMQFFHAELLFDVGRHEDAARLYAWVAEKDPKGPYYEKAIVNSLLALEKDLPSAEQIEVRRGKSLEPMPLDPQVQRFEKAALRYIQAFPRAEKTPDIRRRLGVLYYSYNHFDEALPIFEQLLKDYPATATGEVAGNLILDIYKLRNDMEGFARKGEEFLANPVIANTKFGAELKLTVAKAGYLRAEKIGGTGDALKAAKEFELFAVNNKTSPLALPAKFKAASAYEKAGDLGSAIRMFLAVLATPTTDPKMREAQADSRTALARIYQQTGQLEAAAKQFEIIGADPKDPVALNALYNAGVLWDALGYLEHATALYERYLAASKKAERVEVLFLIAEMNNRKGRSARALSYYEKYLQERPANSGRSLQALYSVAHLHSRSTGGETKAKAAFKKLTEAYAIAPKAQKVEFAKYAAEARFFAAQDILKELAAVKFTDVDKQQAKAALQVKALREKYIAEMKEVIRFDNGNYIVAALASTGRMLESVATSFSRIPVPKGFQKEEADQYMQLIQGQINGIRAEAKGSYRAAVEKAQEFDVVSDWTRTAQAGLASLDPAASAWAGEVISEGKTADWMEL